MTVDTAVAVAALVLVLVWPTHQQLTIRALRHSLRRQRDQLAQHRRAIVQLQGAAIHPPTSVGQPMPTIGRPLATGGVIPASSAYRLGEGECDVFAPSRALRATLADADATLRLARPPALSDVAAAILGAGRPLTRATLDVQLDRDTRTEVRDGLLAGTLQMVRTHDDEPAYWPTGHPVPGDTVRMAKMPVLPGLVRP